MEENKNLVTEQGAENVEETTKETPKMYSQDEVDKIVGISKARAKAKVEKEYKQKYGDLETVLRAGTGKESVEDMTNTFADFYEKKGIKINRNPSYSDKDIEVLAKADATDVINAGYDEVVEEVDRLSKIGVDNMTARDKAYFKALYEHHKDTERRNELAKIGVTEDVYKSKDFQDFAGKFNSSTPIADIYNIYNKTLPKKDIKPMGSMTNKTSEDGTVKDFYTRDEALQFSKKDFDNNPALFNAVQESMRKW